MISNSVSTSPCFPEGSQDIENKERTSLSLVKHNVILVHSSWVANNKNRAQLWLEAEAVTRNIIW